MNSFKELPSQTADDDSARLREANFFDEPLKDLKLEQRTRQQLRVQFTRKSKKILTDEGAKLNTRRKRRKKGKSKAADLREENKENIAAPLKKSDESFLQEWHDDDVEISDYRSSDDSQDEQLEEWYKDLKSNKARDPNLPPVICNVQKVGPVIRHESSNEEKSWLQNDIADTYLLDMMAKYPAGDNPREIVFDDLVEPRRWIERTHLIAEDVMLMKKNRIFTILRQNRPRNLLAHLRLGYCVTHIPGRPECQLEGRTCTLQCDICGVCCHMYSCTCRLVKRFQWCSHIHAAVLCGGNKFKNDQQVYLHISSRYTQLAHLRATCFDMASDVKPVENNEGAFVVIGWTTEWTPYSILRSSQVDFCHVCPQYKRCPECSVCRHQYLCACTEYMVKKRLCEHCHVVAIFVSENRVNTLKKREFRYLSDVSDNTDEEADPRRDVSPVMLPLRKLYAHHEKSYSIPFRRIQVGSVNDQLVYFVRRCDPERKFVVHTKNRAHCTCSKESTSHLECTDCKMCRHYLTCSCGEADAELCKHTHAVRRYIRRSYIPADSNAESPLEGAIRKALNDFYEGCDTAESDCGPLLVTDENIVAVVENLKSVLSSKIEVEPEVFEPSLSCSDSVESRVDNSEQVLETVDQVFDPKVVSCEKTRPEVDTCMTPITYSSENDAQNSVRVSERTDDTSSGTVEGETKSATEINGLRFCNNSAKSVGHLEPVSLESPINDCHTSISAEINRMNLLSSDSVEESEFSFQPVFEQSCNEDSLKAGEPVMVEENSEVERQLQPIQQTGFISANGSETNLVAENVFQAELLQCSPLDSESIREHCVADEASAAKEFRKTMEANSSTSLNTGFNETRASEKDEKEVFKSSDSSSMLTLSSFYDLQFEPVLEVHYKGDTDVNKKSSTVLAESRRCIVTVTDGEKQSSPPSEPVLLQDFLSKLEKMKEKEDSVKREKSKLGTVGKHLELFSNEENAPRLKSVRVSKETGKPGFGSQHLELFSNEKNVHMKSVQTNGHLHGCCKEADKNEISIETDGSNIVAKDVEKNHAIRSVVDWEPVFIEDFPFTERKVRKNVLPETSPSVVGEDFRKCVEASRFLNAEPASFDLEHSFDDFGTVKEDEMLIPKESSGSTNFGKAFKEKSLNFMRKLNLVKRYKERQKKDTSPSTFFGDRNWSRSRRLREMAVLQSITDEFSDTSVFNENFDWS